MPLPRIETPKYELIIPSSGKTVKYRPFLVKEEKILLIAMESEDDKQMMNAIEEIIKNCIYDSDINVKELAIFDIEYIFLQLRSKSKGEEISLTFDCEDCKSQIPVNLNLTDVEVVRTEGHENTIALSNNIGVVMKYPSLNLKSKISPDNSEVENIFQSLAFCLESIYDEETVYQAVDQTEQEIMEFFESLPEKEFEKIQIFFNTLPVLKHEVELKCTAKTGKGKSSKICGWTDTKTLEGLQSFFG